MLSLLRGDRPSWADYQQTRALADPSGSASYTMAFPSQSSPPSAAAKKPDSFWNSWLWQGIKIGVPLALGFVFPLGFVASTLLIGGTMAAFTVTEKLGSKGKLEASDGVDIAVDIGTSFIGGALGRLPIFQGAKTYVAAFVKSAIGGGVSGAATGGIGQALKDGINKGEFDLAHVAESALHGGVGGAAFGGAFGLVGHKLQTMATAKNASTPAKETPVKVKDEHVSTPVEEPRPVRPPRRSARRKMRMNDDTPRSDVPKPKRVRSTEKRAPVDPAELPPIRMPKIDPKRVRVNEPLAKNISDHVEEGLRLLRLGKHKEAIEHFSKPVPGDGTTHIRVYDELVTCPNGDKGSLAQFFKEIQGSAERFRYPGSKRLLGLEIKLPKLKPHTVPENPTGDAKRAFDRAEKEIAFGCAEEWIHALQYALGKPLSRQGGMAYKYARGENFTNRTIHEYDIVRFMKENRLSVPKTFMGRYERSAVQDFMREHSRLNPAEMATLRNHISSQPELHISNMGMTQDNFVLAVHCARNKNRMICEPGKLRIFDPLSHLDDLSLTLRRLAGGGYSLGHATAGGPPVRFKLPDGRWQRLTSPMELPSGTHIRIGLTHFVLP